MGGCCGGKSKATGMEIQVTFPDGSVRRVPDVAAARAAITLNGGAGTYKAVPKSGRMDKTDSSA